MAAALDSLFSAKLVVSGNAMLPCRDATAPTQSLGLVL